MVIIQGCILQQQQLKARLYKDRTKTTAVEWTSWTTFSGFGNCLWC